MDCLISHLLCTPNSAGTGTELSSSGTNIVGVTNGLFHHHNKLRRCVRRQRCWMQISTRSHAFGSFVALTPLQELTPTPYAIFANHGQQHFRHTAFGQSERTYVNAVTLNNGANVFAGNGGG